MKVVPTIRRVLPRLLLVGTLGVALGQTVDKFTQSADLFARKVWVNRHATALERGADAAYGEVFMRLVTLVRTETPDSATILLLGTNSDPQFRSAYYLEFFFFPRQVILCSTEDVDACVRTHQGQQLFLLDSEGSLARRGIPAGSSARILGDRLQVVGRFTPPEEQPSVSGWTLAALDGLVLVALGGLGAAIAASMLRDPDRGLVAAVAVGLGGGVLSWALFLVSWAGARLTAPVVGGVFLGLLTASAVAWRLTHRRAAGAPDIEGLRASGDPLPLVLNSITGILVGAASLLSWGLAYHSWDAASIWGVKGYAIAEMQSIFAAGNWGTISLAFPLNVPILIGLFYGIDGDLLPGSKLLFPVYYACLLAIVHRFWVREGVSRRVAALGTLLLAGTPLVFTHATMAYTNLPLTFYMVGGGLLLVEASRENRPGKALLGGTLLAIGVWTRPEGVLLSAAIVLGYLAFDTIPRRRAGLMVFVIPVLLVALVWAFFQSRYYAEVDEYMVSRLGLEALLRGDIRWPAVVRILRFFVGQAIRYREYGLLLLVDFVLLAAGIKSFLRRSRATAILLAVFAAMLGSTVMGIMYVFAFHPLGLAAVVDRLGSDFSRVFLPAAVMLTVASILSLDSTMRSAPPIYPPGARQVTPVHFKNRKEESPLPAAPGE
jgi:hypothetical protein